MSYLTSYFGPGKSGIDDVNHFVLASMRLYLLISTPFF